MDVDGGKDFHERLKKHGIDWETHYAASDGQEPQEVKSGTRVTIELEGRFIRGRGSVDEYLEQTAIANPHVTLHYKDADGNETSYERPTTDMPPEPKEIKPHPYGVELGRLVTMLKDTRAGTISALTDSFSRVSSSVARKVCEEAKISTRMNPKKVGRQEADALYQAIQNTRISIPFDRLPRAHWRAAHSERLASGGAGRVLLCRDASAGRVSRQSLLDRSRPGVRRRLEAARSRWRHWLSCSAKATPARCGSS